MNITLSGRFQARNEDCLCASQTPYDPFSVINLVPRFDSWGQHGSGNIGSCHGRRAHRWRFSSPWFPPAVSINELI